MAGSVSTESKNTINVLILDDQRMWLETTQVNCEAIFAEVKRESESFSSESKVEYFLCQTVDEATAILSETLIHILFLDKDLGESSDGKKITGVDQIAKFKSIQPFCQILMLTADSSPTDIARAFRSGASDYLLKSTDQNLKEYRHEVIKRALEYFSRDVSQAKSISKPSNRIYSRFVATSPAMQRFENKLTAVSESRRPVLLLGDSGLGKGAAARRINELSAEHFSQESRPFVQLNIGSTDKAMSESILFGTEPGAFTGAHSRTKAGLLDLARNGDIFLDEIGDASPDLQLKLLKVIEEKEYYRVGGNTPIKTNARFILATNRNLRELVDGGLFRQDLYMRISVFEETLPALRERKSDLPEIVRGFLEHALFEYPKKKIRFEDFTPEMVKYFSRDEIPGNIRGIENDIFRLVAHTPVDEIGKPDFRNWRKTLAINGAVNVEGVLTYKKVMASKFDLHESAFPGLRKLTEGIEQRIFEDLKNSGASVNEIVKITKISRNTVLERMKRYGLSTRELRQ